MQLSEPPRIELANARTCIELMRNAKSLDEFEKNWKSFLHDLERIWYKTNHHYRKSPSWNGWKERIRVSFFRGVGIPALGAEFTLLSIAELYLRLGGTVNNRENRARRSYPDKKSSRTG